MKTTPHLYGPTPYLPDAYFADSDELFRLTGGNTGNLLFCHALSRILPTALNAIPRGGELSDLGTSDRLVLQLSNHLGSHVDMSGEAERLRQVEAPIVAVGLGAQGPISGVLSNAIPEGSWEWLRVIAMKSASGGPNIALRGKTTFDLLAAKGLGDRCVVTGCPSNFINPSATLGREIARRRANGLSRIAVAAGNPNLAQFQKLEQSLASMMERHDGMYVCQHPIEMLRLCNGEYAKISTPKLRSLKEYIRPNLDDDKFLHWFRRWARTFTSVSEWMASLSRCDLVIGTRFHGVMAGIQAGVPSLCLCIDSRTAELCETMQIPYANANEYRDGVHVEKVAEILRKWDGRRFDDMRRSLADRLLRFLKNNGLDPAGPLAKIHSEHSVIAASNSAKTDLPEVHQVNTASNDMRYTAIFRSLRQSVQRQAPRILSFGCSDGYELNELATIHFHHAEIIGCDVDKTALRIARGANLYPCRVKVVESNRELMQDSAPFDAITAMAVLCRWPQTEKMTDISEIYPFEKFSESIAFLTKLLQPGGVLCVSNANYRVEDTSSMQFLDTVETPELVPCPQQVRLFEPTGRPRSSQQVTAVLFRKRHIMQNAI